MKYFLSFLLLFFTSVVGYTNHFKNKKQQYIIAFTYQPSWYMLYNKNDWNNKPPAPNPRFDYESIPSNPKGFNGHTLGISFEIPFAKQLVLQTELLYGTQFQYHKINPIRSISIDPNSETLFYKDLKNTIQQLRIPFMLKYKLNIGESNFTISGMAGMQVSYTLNYHTEHKTYRTIRTSDSLGIVTTKIYSDSLSIYISKTKNKSIYKTWDDDGNFIEQGEAINKKLFHDFNLGVLAAVELSTVLNSHIFMSFGGRLEYDFTNATTNNGSYQIPNPSIRNDNPLAPSHNIRYGFTISAGYVFK